MRIPSIAACLLLIAANSARAITPEQEAVARKGLDSLYQNDFAGAESAFGDSSRAHPDDPLYSLGAAVAAWWRMESAFALPGSRDEDSFKAAVERAIETGKKAVDRDKSADAHLYLATGFGLRARRRAANRQWFRAYLDGRRAHRYAQKALELDPALIDANLGIGAFDYYVATLSRLVRTLAFATGGDRSQGLLRLETAAAQGRFSQIPAKLVLVGIYWTFEKKPEEAWRLIEDVTRQYPDSPMVREMRLVGRFQLRDAPGLEKDARAFLASAQSGARYFQPIDRVVGRGFLGLARQLSSDPGSALLEYQAAWDETPPGHRWRSALALFKGEALDLLGRRQEAVSEYERALREAPLWGVHRYARRLLDRPFKAGDDPLPSRGAEL